MAEFLSDNLGSRWLARSSLCLSQASILPQYHDSSQAFIQGSSRKMHSIHAWSRSHKSVLRSCLNSGLQTRYNAVRCIAFMPLLPWDCCVMPPLRPISDSGSSHSSYHTHIMDGLIELPLDCDLALKVIIRDNSPQMMISQRCYIYIYICCFCCINLYALWVRRM